MRHSTARLSKASIQLKMRSRVARIANQHLYDRLPRLTPEQINTLSQKPYMMADLVNRFGPDVVRVMMTQTGKE